LSARTQDDGQLPRIDLEAFDERLCLGIRLRIKPLTGMAVPRQKAFEPKHIAVLRTADNHGPAGPSFQQADPAQDQGAHDALADFSLGHEHRPNALRRDDQGLYGFERMGIDKRGPASKLRQFAHEGTWPVGDDWRAWTWPIVLGYVDRAGKDDDEAVANLANCRESIAASRLGPMPARTAQRRELKMSATTSSIIDTRRHQMFPTLEPAEIERLRRFGNVRAFAEQRGELSLARTPRAG
jgi:hypothetical protein